MGILDLNSILLKDTEFYSRYGAYIGALKKFNITTVGQLLDQNINDINLHRGTYIELCVFINMLKYRYLGTPLPYGKLLDNEIMIGSVKKTPYNFEQVLPLVDDKKQTTHILYSRLLSTADRLLVYKFLDAIKQDKIRTYDGNIRLVDFLRWISNCNILGASVNACAKAYVEEYDLDLDGTRKLASLKNELEKMIKDKQKYDSAIIEAYTDICHESSNTGDSISLNEELVSLITRREKYDIAIAHIQKEIDEATNSATEYKTKIM